MQHPKEGNLINSALMFKQHLYRGLISKHLLHLISLHAKEIQRNIGLISDTCAGYILGEMTLVLMVGIIPLERG